MAKRKIGLDKLRDAKRQLNTAINRLFNAGDMVSTQTLTMAAVRILYNLSKKKKVKPAGK